MIKKEKLVKRKSFACTEQQLILIAQKRIRDEKFRAFIENYGTNGEDKKTIRSDEWRKLKKIIEKVPSLQLIGAVGAGKTHICRELIRGDKEHVYIVLDSHGCYSDFLPKIHQISPNVKESCVLELPKNDEAAGLNFKLYKTLIQLEIYPKHFILTIDESLRYRDYGIENLLAESRKFLKVLAISQARLVDFVPEIHVENYNKINI